MLSNKVVLTIGALLLATVAVASASDCVGCRNTELVNAINSLDASRQCWFSPKNHILLEIKTYCLVAVGKLLQNVVTSANLVSSLQCRTLSVQPCLQTLNQDDLAQCAINNLAVLAQSYRQLEQCNGKSLVDPAQIDLALKVILGTITGWRVPHPEC